jgi:hypothetical protein
MKITTKLYLALLILTLALGGLMMVWSLPKIANMAGGLPTFDLRPLGYSLDEATAFLTALSPEGKQFYLNVQQRIDMFYPGLLGLTLLWTLWALVPPSWGIWRFVLPLLAIPPALFDYLENIQVAFFLRQGATAITVNDVATASLWTIIKSQSTTLAMIVIILLIGRWFIRRRRKSV